MLLSKNSTLCSTEVENKLTNKSCSPGMGTVQYLHSKVIVLMTFYSLNFWVLPLSGLRVNLCGFKVGTSTFISNQITITSSTMMTIKRNLTRRENQQAPARVNQIPYSI